MRGQQQSGVRRLNRHWQSGGRRVDPIPARPITRPIYGAYGQYNWYNTWTIYQYTDPPDYDHNLELWDYQPILKVGRARVAEILSDPTNHKYLQLRIAGSNAGFQPNLYADNSNGLRMYLAEPTSSYGTIFRQISCRNYVSTRGTPQSIQVYTGDPNQGGVTQTYSAFINYIDIYFDLTQFLLDYTSAYTGKDIYFSFRYNVGIYNIAPPAAQGTEINMIYSIEVI